MIKSLSATNLTVFQSAQLSFSRRLNVIVGENGAGKTHLLKLLYAVLAVSAEEHRKPGVQIPTKSYLQTRLADKLVNIFRPDTLGRLVRRHQGRGRCDVAVGFTDAALDIEFSFATNSKSEVLINRLPESWVTSSAAYLPTRELLSIFPNFASVYDGHYLEFEETWRDTCVLLGAPLRRGAREAEMRNLLDPIQEAMGGPIELDKNGRFYFKAPDGRMEIPLVAEGVRKLGMIARLIATGALLQNGYLFWDEPEANLNPRLIKKVARTILDLSENGVQIFIATHSLFLLRELSISLSAQRYKSLHPKYFGLHRGADGIDVVQGASMDDIGDIASLDEELEQSNRYLEI